MLTTTNCQWMNMAYHWKKKARPILCMATGMVRTALAMSLTAAPSPFGVRVGSSRAWPPSGATLATERHLQIEAATFRPGAPNSHAGPPRTGWSRSTLCSLSRNRGS